MNVSSEQAFPRTFTLPSTPLLLPSFFHSSIIFVNMVYAANWHLSKDFLLTYPKVPACAQVILYPLILLTNKGYSYFLETKKKIYVLAVHLTDNTKYTLRARTLSLVSFW